MPHSGGGGSSHGGSHHSSSHIHSGSSSSSNTHRISNTYFSGSHVYVRYVNKRPQYVYTASPPDPKRDKANMAVMIVIYAVILLLAVLPGIRIGTKLSHHGVENTEVEIIDHGYDFGDADGYLGDTSSLQRTLQKVEDKTGMIPVVVALDNSEWQDYSYSLEAYAYDLYVSRYSDEKHIMIVYSYGNDGSMFGDWYWESMYGDDTTKLLTQTISNKFADDLNENILRCDTVAEAIDVTYQKYINKFTGIHVDMSILVMFVFITIWFGIVFAINMTSINTQRKKLEGFTEVKGAVIVNNAPKEDNCEFCGGLYTIGSYLSCPHCGANLPAHDPQGNRISVPTPNYEQQPMQQS